MDHIYYREFSPNTRDKQRELGRQVFPEFMNQQVIVMDNGSIAGKIGYVWGADELERKLVVGVDWNNQYVAYANKVELWTWRDSFRAFMLNPFNWFLGVEFRNRLRYTYAIWKGAQ